MLARPPIFRVKLLSLDIGLRGVWRRARRPLKGVALRLIGPQALGRRSESIGDGGEVVALVEVPSVALSGRARLTALRQGLSRLRRGDQPEVMLGVLQVVFGGDRIASRMRVSRKLKVFLCDVLRGASNFHVGAVQFVGTRQWIGASAVVRGPAAHPLVLTWSHCFFRLSILLRLSVADARERPPRTSSALTPASRPLIAAVEAAFRGCRQPARSLDASRRLLARPASVTQLKPRTLALSAASQRRPFALPANGSHLVMSCSVASTGG